MNFKFITDVLEENGLTCIVDDGRLYIEINDIRLEIKFIDDYLEIIDRFSRSRQYNFSTEKNTLVSYREVEVVVQRLNQNTFEVSSVRI